MGRDPAGEASLGVSADYSDSGTASDERSLKHRNDEPTRSVQWPPELTEHLHRHLERYGTGRTGLLFWGGSLLQALVPTRRHILHG
ncbi:hypothetical protein [Saccharopolyspora taberi]|uniref:Uncharacterized protein n=1 Tax=Saccharopolyspora taberi TaxID=60895 RepID=A0ABN3VMV8_9PSEU